MESFLHIAYFLLLGNYSIPAKFQLNLMKFRGRLKVHIYTGLWNMCVRLLVFATANLIFAFCTAAVK